MPSDEFKGICYDLEVKKPLAIAGFVQMLRYFLRRTLEDPRGSTSYGLRLPESEKLALQNWIDKGVAIGQTPARYSASKLRASTLLKLCLLGAAENFAFKAAWKDISHAEVQQQLAIDRPSMDTLMSQSDEEVLSSKVPDPDKMALILKPVFIQAAKRCLLPLRDRMVDSAGQASGASLPIAAAECNPGADEFYDLLAWEKWSRPGHSGRPELFTVVFQGENMGNIWLGGLPVQSDVRSILGPQKIFLIVSAMKEAAKACGGLDHRKFYQMSVAAGYRAGASDVMGRSPDGDAGHSPVWRASCFRHCRAGVHRGPMLAALAIVPSSQTKFVLVMLRTASLIGSAIKQLVIYLVFACPGLPRAGSLWHVFCRW